MDEAVQREIGKRLRQSRRAVGLTQQAAAEALGLKAGQTVSLWEQGDTVPPGDVLYNLGLLYGVSLDFLAYGAPSLPSARTGLLHKILSASGVEPQGRAFGAPGLEVSPG